GERGRRDHPGEASMIRHVWALVLAGCFSTRSDQFRCGVDADCEGGRTCDRGLCIVTAPDPDAITVTDAPIVDATPCTTSGLTCAGAAHLDCNGVCWVTCTDAVDQPTAAARCTAWGGALTPLRAAADVT